MWKYAVACLLMMALTGCPKPPPRDAARADAAPLQIVNFAYTRQPQSTLVHLATVKNYFRDEGLDVQAVMRTYGKQALQAVLDNKADFATVAETPIMFSVLRGEKIFVIANIDASNTNNGVVARRDAGIASAADLKGKRIAYTAGTTSEFFLDSLLTANGLVRSQVHGVPLDPDAMLEAIMTRQIDAASTWNYPLTKISRALGPNGTLILDREIYTETFNIAATQEYVNKNPDTVRRLLRALIKAEKFAVASPAEAQAIMASVTKVDLDFVRGAWENFHYNVVLDQRLIITLEDETRWAIRHHLTDRTAVPDYLSFIHSESLRAVAPQNVKLDK